MALSPFPSSVSYMPFGVSLSYGTRSAVVGLYVERRCKQKESAANFKAMPNFEANKNDIKTQKWGQPLTHRKQLAPFRLLPSLRSNDHSIFRFHPRNLVDLQFLCARIIIELYPITARQQFIDRCNSFRRKLDLCPHLFHLMEKLNICLFLSI